MAIPEKCPLCGSQPSVACGEDNISGELTGLVLCLECMSVLAVSVVSDVRERVSGLLCDEAIEQYNSARNQ